MDCSPPSYESTMFETPTFGSVEGTKSIGIIEEVKKPPTDSARMEAYEKLVKEKGISPFFAAKLRKLEQYKIVFLIDDSGSMATPLAPPPEDPFRAPMKRWDEARDIVMSTIDICSCMTSEGVDVYFLNRPTLRGVTLDNKSELAAEFDKPPAGYTPLSNSLRNIFSEQKKFLIEGKIILIVVTDGSPTTETGESDTVNFINVLKTERPPAEKMPISFIACTDDDKSVEYLNDIDSKLPMIDVTDDFHTEKKQILNIQGASFSFLHIDYTVKALLGPVDKDLDLLDEVKIGTPDYRPPHHQPPIDDGRTAVKHQHKKAKKSNKKCVIL